MIGETTNCLEILESLLSLSYLLLAVDSFDASAPMLANQRQKQCVKNALGHIDEALSASLSGLTYDAVNVMIDSAVDDLLMLTGRKATIEIVNNIFSKFCVGK